MRTSAKKLNHSHQAVASSIVRSAAKASESNHHVTPSLHLQRTVGNQTVQRFLQADVEERQTGSATISRTNVGRDFSKIPFYPNARTGIQPKLTIRNPRDRYEQEADRIADEVMRIPDGTVTDTASSGRPSIQATDALTTSGSASIQRACTECADEESGLQRAPLADSFALPHISPLKGTVARRTAYPDQTALIQRRSIEDEEEETRHNKTAANGAPEISQGVEAQIRALQGRGRPLPSTERAFFESRFGHDFSQVRVHSGIQAAESARAIRARAFTVGRDVVFRTGEYAPATAKGRKLLAHELTHVVQQSGAPAARTIQRQSCDTSKSPVEKTTVSELLKITTKKPPCYACPNSPSNACPKLAQKIMPPVRTPAVQFSWQVSFQSFQREKGTAGPGPGKNTHVIQEIEKIFNFSVAPAHAFPFTPLYWEAFELDDLGQTEIDYWQFEIPDLTAGTWEMRGTLYLTNQLPEGMEVGNVTEAQGLPSTIDKPSGLGRKLGTRRIAGRFDFTGANKRHMSQ